LFKEVILIKNGELALKGLNRRTFEEALIRNLKRTLTPFGKISVHREQSTMYVNSDDIDWNEAADRVSRVFGIATFSRSCLCEKDFEVIKESAAEYLKEQLSECSTFKVEAKRSDKSFPLKSPAICEEAGGYILERFPNLTVDVHNPEITVTVEIRANGAFIHGKPIKGAGGLPFGTSGKATVMISGGIDSPVAAWMMAKRGLQLSAVHFASPPYTSQRAEEKVRTLLEKVSQWAGEIKLYIVPFTDIQERIRDDCPEELFTIIMRRIMIKITQRIARSNQSSAMISGESVGQVASQTLKAIACTNDAANMPILRPLVGMDKEEIIKIARSIDTFDTSILPYEDCCTVFTPKHPKTRPDLHSVREAEAKLNIADLMETAIKESRKEFIGK
jgi:thiamine biosynthesis protein ThiI